MHVAKQTADFNQIAESYNSTWSEQIKKGPFESCRYGCSYFQLFYILTRIIPDYQYRSNWTQKESVS